jgi:hypothetical protein
MKVSPGMRRLVLTAHITTSVGLLGAVASFLVLAVLGLTSANMLAARAAYLAMERVAWLVIVPLAFTSLLIGIVQSVSTAWGLFQHYWVIAKLALTLLVTVVLLLQMKTIATMARAASESALLSADLHRLRLSLVIHAAGGLLVLLGPVALSVYKPAGKTRLGRKRLGELA